MIKGKTKSGIKFQLDERIKDDARLLFLVTRAQNTDDPMTMSKAMMDLLTLVFGSEDNVLAFMNEVAAKNKGLCNSEKMLNELSDMFEAINAKNS